MASENQDVLTVSQLTSYMKETLEATFHDIWVGGEVSGVTRPSSGHIYFTLRDREAQLRCAIWRTAAQWLKFEIQDGMEVVCRGDIDLYAPRGSYQLIIGAIQPQGVGALQLAFQQLYRQLKSEGLFEERHKRPLPSLPRRIGLVTSPTGAAVRDFLQIGLRRWNDLQLFVVPCRVQGDGASVEIARAIRLANRMRPALDVLVVGRGGGSAEDLWCFNEEPVVRAIFESKIPVVSAVGHEVDVSLSDLVADHRALTPSEAAEIVVPEKSQLRQRVAGLQTALANQLVRRAKRAADRLDSLASRRVMKRPLEYVYQKSRRLDELETRIGYWRRVFLQQYRERLKNTAARLESVSPLAVLARGYGLVTGEAGVPISSVDDVDVSDSIRVQLNDGEIAGRVTDVRAKREK